MSETEPTQKLYSDLLALKQSFETVIRRFEAGDLIEVVRLSSEVKDKARDSMRTLTSSYEKGLDQRLSMLSKAESSLADLSGKSDLSQEGCLNLILSLEKSIRQIEREIFFQYPKPILIPFLKKNARKAAVFFVTGLVVVFSFFLLKQFRMRKHGLMGSYYQGSNFEKLLKTRLDHQIKFDWVRQSPLWGVPRDHFSIRWDGFLLIPRDGVYTFYLSSDDGSRLIIDDQTLIDDWHVQRYTMNQSTMSLAAGNHKIKIEYFEAGNTAGCELDWRFESDRVPTVVPAENLVPSEKFLSAR